MLSRTSRILLVVAALAVGLYVLIELPRQRKADNAEEPETLLPGFNPASVDTLMLYRSDDTLSFARYEDGWHMRDQVFDIAEPGAIETLLDAIASARPQRNLGVAGDVSVYGLDKPEVSIRLAQPGEHFAISVGQNTVDDAWCYARVGDGDILLIPTGVRRAALLPRDDYRNHRVVDFQLAEVTRYSLADDEHGTTWTRHKNGWITSLALDDTIPGDSVAVESVLRRLRGLRALSFLERTGAQGATYSALIKLHRADGSPLAFLNFWRMPDGSWRVHNSLRETDMVVDGDLIDLFAHTTTSLRDRRLLQFNPADAARVEIVFPDANGSLVRAGGAWAFPNPALGRIDPERTAEFVRALRSLKWGDLPPEGITPPKTFRFSITVTGAGGTILDEMRAEPRPGEARWWVTSQSSDGPWLIESALLTHLAANFERLRAK